MGIIAAVAVVVGSFLAQSDAWDFCVEDVGVEECSRMSDEQVRCIYETDGMSDCTGVE